MANDRNWSSPGNDGRLATTFRRVIPIPVVGEKVLQRSQQKGTEPAILGSDGSQSVLLNQTGKEILRQIFSLVWTAPLSSDESIERIPIGLAKRSQLILAML